MRASVYDGPGQQPDAERNRCGSSCSDAGLVSFALRVGIEQGVTGDRAGGRLDLQATGPAGRTARAYDLRRVISVARTRRDNQFAAHGN